jgi:hypothetical protein
VKFCSTEDQCPYLLSLFLETLLSTWQFQLMEDDTLYTRSFEKMADGSLEKKEIQP